MLDRCPAFARWLALATLIIVLDQISKLLIIGHFNYGEDYVIASVFSLTLVHNPGAAFSFLSDAGGVQRWLFSGLAVVASVWMTVLLKRHGDKLLFALALSLILGGALGNLIDRIAYGYVVDFLLFHWDTHYFPAFNLADSAITGGAILLILESLLEKKHEHTAR
ncbi:MAG: signal peptidase II [Gallionella sp.]|nr:signal peptidase II [Gallionella sp.]MDD4946903.1 signal peptidase II [Gallionella sp.]MDD5612545.1 signal peptidase II [Gallionella sp.]